MRVASTAVVSWLVGLEKEDVADDSSPEVLESMEDDPNIHEEEVLTG